jgi:hypothetical protein
MFWYPVARLLLTAQLTWGYQKKKPEPVFVNLLSRGVPESISSLAAGTTTLFVLVFPAGQRARIFKLLRGPGFDSKESIPPSYDVALRAGTITLFLPGS